MGDMNDRNPSNWHRGSMRWLSLRFDGCIYLRPLSSESFPAWVRQLSASPLSRAIHSSRRWWSVLDSCSQHARSAPLQPLWLGSCRYDGLSAISSLALASAFRPVRCAASYSLYRAHWRVLSGSWALHSGGGTTWQRRLTNHCSGPNRPLRGRLGR